MRLRRSIWPVLSVIAYITGMGLWWLANQRSAQPGTAPSTPLQFLGRPASPDTRPITFHASRFTPPFSLRLTNTTAPLGQLLHRPSAILMENALLDTAEPLTLPIPERLRAKDDPGAYIVQSRAPLNDTFRALLRSAGAEIVAYIPNQAYLVRAPQAVVQRLQADARTQAVLPYEPYFKLKPPLLARAVQRQPPPTDGALNLLLFPDAAAGAFDDLKRLGVDVLARESSPFGPVLRVRAVRRGETLGLARTPALPEDLLPALAGLAGVQEVELARHRVMANDLSRARIGVATNTTTPDNYLGLTGTNVLVAIADSGVDTNQPDLQGRVLLDGSISGVDSNGHGTHVAGIIAGSGLESPTVTNASGSFMPGTDFQFRGKAPAAKVFAMLASPDPGPASDSYLQETAAQTNAFISNNSWHYADDNAYDLAAARYDAAVRDALPGVTGPQPLLFVFGAGNAGNGADDGSGGDPDSIQSPGTAKNLITVGAIDQPRAITNEVWQCTDVDGTNVCQTNQPWLGLTYTDDVVAAFSSRGNVGAGIEGAFGRVKPDVVAPGTFVLSTRSTQWDQVAYYGPADTNSNYSEVLSNLNETIGPFYRYESGTSLAAAEVSGALALMQEFFQGYALTNSPALMKALLINGARPLTGSSAFQVTSPANIQGWGLINLTNTLPRGLSNAFAQAAASMQVFDQTPDSALATGQSHTHFVALSSEATNYPLRCTLVWTDPPGNPAASVKLVNNLDLIVTNLDTGEVFLGNDISPGSTTNQPWNTSLPAVQDVVNNVENVYLGPGTATNYSVTVLARAVNVNAVTARTNDVVQDYALVLSSGNGQVCDALTVANAPIVSEMAASVTFVTNTFDPSQGVSGALLLNQRAGGPSPLADGATVPWPGGTNGLITVGVTNQWRFYVLTNDQDYTYAAFATFLPPTLSLPRLALNETSLTNSSLPEADIDLYVSTDAALTNLDTAALAAADKALSRSGTQALVYSNVAPGARYYVGVKAEDQQAAQYAFLGAFSLLPFGEQDYNGSWTLRGINLPALVADGTSTLPGVTNVVAIAPAPVAIQRVVVTNELAAENFTKLLSTVSHGRVSAALHNHSLPPGDPVPSDYTYAYEDNGQGDVPGSQPTDGPGSLRDFIGQEGCGVWLLTLFNEAPGQMGVVSNLSIRLDPQNVTGGGTRGVVTNAFSYDFLDVPIGGTNLTLCLNNESFPLLPVEVYLRLGALPTPTDYDYLLPVDSTSGCLSIAPYSLPPLRPGRYFIGVFNPGYEPQIVRITTQVDVAPGYVPAAIYTAGAPVPIPDDAVTRASLLVTNTQPIASVDVGLILTNHPRVSDMVLTLISPTGTRVLLFDGRGAAITGGLGGLVLRTNIYPTRSSGDFNANTNVLFVGSSPGTVTIDSDFYLAPDTMDVYYGTNVLYSSGEISGTNSVFLPFGPDVFTNAATNIVIIMNQNASGDTNTLWEYTATVISELDSSVVFTENTNLEPVPIKFVVPPFVPSGTNLDLYCVPEQSLNLLLGENPYGLWRLELWDTRAGPAEAAPDLQHWELRFVFQNNAPVPIVLHEGTAGTNSVPTNQVAPFAVDVPAWATRATNILLYASAPVNVLFNQYLPPTGTNSGDLMLLSASTSNTIVLDTGSIPPLVPGAPYYLGIQNTGAVSVTAALQVAFDVIPLSAGEPVTNTHPANNLSQYFSYDVPPDATAVAFQLLNLEADLSLVARQAPSLPTLTGFDYASLNPGTNDESILVFSDSTPVPLTPGLWYLGVFNASATNAAYTILVTEYTNIFPTIITLSSGVPNSAYNPDMNDVTDYYHYAVSSNAVRAQFSITDASGNMTLIARKDLPLPNLTNFAYMSANPWPNDELITIFDSSTPVPLTPGDWFIVAVNVSGGPASYTITATEFPVYGTNFLITDTQALSDSFCLTWTSLPGIQYYVQAKTDVNTTNWTTLSPTLTATDPLTTYCVPLPSPYRFFRVGEGLVITPPLPPVIIGNITFATNGVCLQWTASTNYQFEVQWTPSLTPPAWNPFTDILTSTNGDFSFLDDGSQSGGLTGPRYYRLRQLP